ncbi:hypothetical protein BDR07DRAFT_1414846 [Suillus spraguei]|nr:hypothetical protein BDR07DRAFT_1414846 [Suillus spraguei]
MDHTGIPNHKQSDAIMPELEDATGIDAQTLGGRHRVLIFGVQIPIMYGERKQNALGQLLQEIVAVSGDINYSCRTRCYSYLKVRCSDLWLSSQP